MDLTEGIGHHDIMQNRRIFINQNKKNPDIARRNRFNRSEMTRGTAPDGFPMGPSAWSSHGLPIGFAAKTHVRGLSWPPTMLGLELVLSNDVLLQYDIYICNYCRYMWKLQEAGFDFGNCTRKLLRNDEDCQQFIKFRASLRNWTLSIGYDIWEC